MDTVDFMNYPFYSQVRNKLGVINIGVYFLCISLEMWRKINLTKGGGLNLLKAREGCTISRHLRVPCLIQKLRLLKLSFQMQGNIPKFLGPIVRYHEYFNRGIVLIATTSAWIMTSSLVEYTGQVLSRKRDEFFIPVEYFVGVFFSYQRSKLLETKMNSPKFSS